MTEIQLTTTNFVSKKGLFQSMFDSYGLLVDNPWALSIFLVGCLSIISELHNSFGPLEMISNALLAYCNSSKTPLLPVATFLLQIVNWIIPIKINFFLCLFFLIPAIIRPTFPYWMTSLAFCALTIFTALPTLELFLFSQFYFMYCFTTDPWYKFIIFFFSFIILIIGFTAFSSMVGVN